MSLPGKTLVAALAIAGSLLSNTPSRADAPVALLTQAPVALAACQVDYTFRTGYAYGSSIPFVNGVDLRFSNQRKIEASEVDIDLAYNGWETTILDRGRFDVGPVAWRGLDWTSSGAAHAPLVVALGYAALAVWDNGSRPESAATRYRSST